MIKINIIQENNMNNIYKTKIMTIFSSLVYALILVVFIACNDDEKITIDSASKDKTSKTDNPCLPGQDC